MHERLRSRLDRLGPRGHRALVAGVVHRGEPVLCGWAAEGPEPDASSLLEIGSITKALTGVLLADMTLRGEVSLQDPLSTHLPAPRPAWRGREPTLLELATHRSGLPNTPGPMGRGELAYALGLRRTDPWAGVRPVDYARLVTEESPRRAPGGRVAYSSMGVGLLGDALAARAGTSYEELLRERVLAPLRMTSTWVRVPPERSGDVLVGHGRRGRPRPPIQDHMPAAGSLRSTSGDMLAFLAASLAPPSGPVGEALALAQQPHARLGRRVELGLCWVISTPPRGAPRLVWHNGGTWGFRAWAGFSPELEAAAVVMSASARSVDRTGFQLLEDLRPPVTGPWRPS